MSENALGLVRTGLTTPLNRAIYRLDIDRWLWMELTSGGRKARRFFLGPSGPAKRRMRTKTAEDRNLLQLLEPVAEAAGYEVVRLRLMGGGRRTLQIMAERPDGSMSIEDCTRLSRTISEVLEAADPISGEYMLEVSTPGIDRPLTRIKDFERWEGWEARLELDRLAEGRKRFKGVLAGIDGDNVGIDLEGEEDTTVYLPFAWIAEAKLVLNDELMKLGAEQRAERLAREAEMEQDEEADSPPSRRSAAAPPAEAGGDWTEEDEG
jgi:ribosome maturation factor RimP